MGAPPSSVITAYLKPTNYCNVGCSHCYLPAETRGSKARMSWDTLVQAGEFLAEMRARQGASGVHVVWHGGEPLTVSPEWYERAGEVLDQVLRTHREGIQTSLIPYDGRFRRLIRERFDGVIGSSIDFSSRRIKGHAGAYQTLWLSKVFQARQDGLMVIPGMVVSRHEIGRAKEILHWFVQNDFDQFNVERYNSYKQVLPECPTNKEHAQFLIELFDAVMELTDTTGGAPRIRAIEAGIRGVLFGTPGDRWGGDCQSSFVVVDPNGGLNNCPDKIAHDVSYGTVGEGFDAFAKSDGRRSAIRLQVAGHRNQWCASCTYNRWCRSGCPIACNSPSVEDPECSGYRSFLNHAKAYLASPHGHDVAMQYLGGSREPVAYGGASAA